MKQWFLALLIIVTWGCSTQKKKVLPKEFQEFKSLTIYSTDIVPSKTIEFVKKAVYGKPKEALIGRMGDLAVDCSGRVFIADIQNQSINVFQSDGRFLVQLGREGRGPSEFTSIKNVQIRKDSLYVYDPSQQKISVTTLDSLAEDKSILLAKNRGKYQELINAYPWIHKIYIRNDGTYLAQFILEDSTSNKKWQNIEMKGLFYLLDDNGMITSKLFELTSETRTQLEAFLYLIKPFFGKALTVLSNDNSIYWAGPDHFLIKVYSPEGAYRRSFYYPTEEISLTKESALEAGVPDLFIKNMESMDLPKTWPVLTDMKIDDQDRLWIATTVKDMNVYEWWVLENTGELITKFEWPRDQPIEVVKNGYMYTRETDEKTGLQQVVKYRIKMNRSAEVQMQFYHFFYEYVQNLSPARPDGLW